MTTPRKLVELAARQGGHISRVQLLAGGMSERAIDRRVESGEFEVVADGVYRLFRPNNHLDLILGALLALPKAVASHESAAHLLDLPRLPVLKPTVTVASHTTHIFPDVVVRRCDDLKPSHLTHLNGVALTTVARTIFDLAGILTSQEFSEVAEAALLSRRLEHRHLERVHRELSRRGKRGSRAVKRFLEERAGDPAATPLERRGRAVLAGGGLPLPVPQFPIPWAAEMRFDDAYPKARLAIEWDSRGWHEQRAAMAADRKRDRIAAAHSWVVVRITFQDLTQNPAEVVATVSKALTARLAAV